MNDQKKPSSSLKKIAWIGFALILACVLILLSTVAIFILSPTLQTWVVEKSKDSLKPVGIEWQADDFKVDLLRRVEFKNLNLSLSSPLAAQGNVKVETFVLAFNLSSILSKKMIVEAVEIKNVNADLIVKSSGPSATEPPPQVDAAEPFDLVGFIKNPPASLEINRIEFENVKLKVLLEDERDPGLGTSRKTSLRLDLNLTDLDFSLNLKDGQAFASWQQKMISSVIFSSDSLPSGVALDMGSSIDSKGELSLTSKGDEIEHRLSLSSMNFGLDNLKLKSTQYQIPKLQSTVVEAKSQLPLETRVSLKELRYALRGDFNIVGVTDLRKLNISGFGSDLITQNLTLQVGSDTLVHAPSSKISTSLRSDGEKPEGSLDVTVTGLKLSSSPLPVLNIKHGSKLSGTFVDPQLRIKSLSTVNKVLAAQSTVEFKDLDQTTTVEMKLNSSELRTLARMFGLPLAVSNLALSQVSLEQKLHFYNDKPIWLNDFSNLNLIKVDQNLQVRLLQDSNMAAKESPKFKELVFSAQSKLESSQLVSSAQLEVAELRLAALGTNDLSPRVQLSVQSRIAAPLNGTLNTKVTVRTSKPSMDETLLTMGTTFADEQNLFRSGSELKVHVAQEWSGFSKLAEILKSIGGLDLEGTVQVEMPHQSQSVVDADFKQVNRAVRLKTAADLKIGLTQPKSGEARLFVLPEPILLNLKSDLNDKALSADVELNLASASSPIQGGVSGVAVGLNAQIPDLSTLASIEAAADVSVASFNILAEIPDREAIARTLGALQVDVEVGVADQKSIDLKKLEVSLGDKLLTLSGTGRMNTQNAGEFKADTRIVFPGKIGPSTEVTGSLSVPIAASLFRDNRVSVSVQPQFSDVSARLADLEMKGLSGRLSVSEELKLNKNGSIDFVYLEKQSPFARVDFENIEPLMSGSPVLRIDSIKSGALELKSLVSKIEIRQNMFLLNEMNLEGLGGSIVGRAFGSFDPSNPQLGFLGRFSNLDPKYLLAKNSESPSGVLSGRGAVEFDVRKRLAKGRVDVTSIGRDQLLRLLDVIDPGLRDPQINSARKALYIAAPTKIVLTMDQGLMDLEIDLETIVDNRLAIRSIPLTPLIVANADESLKALDVLFNHEGVEP